MPTIGETKDVALPPFGNKEIDPVENFVPNQIDLRNGFITDSGNWHKRPGYAEKHDTGIDSQVSQMFPQDTFGYATLSEGSIFKVEDSAATVVSGAKLSGALRPSIANHQGIILFFDGGVPVKVSGGVASVLGGSPPHSKWVDVLDTYVIAAGHTLTGFRWSALANSESWPSANFNDVSGDGEEIKFFKVHKRRMFFFKSKSIEIWLNSGTSAIFTRQSFIERGTHASDSVVQANDTFYFLGDDGNFYILNGFQPKIISQSYKRELDKIPRVNQEKIYGFNYEKESVIRWFAPIEGRCFVYNYKTNTFSEDNKWSGGFTRLPHYSYMEINGKQYFGDYNLTGKIYEWSKDHKDDDGEPIRVFRKFAVPFTGLASVNKMTIRTKRGEGISSGTVDAQMMVRWRFDQGDFSHPHNFSLGKLGDRDPFVELWSLGHGREIEIEITETDAVDFLLDRVVLTVEQLDN